MNHDVFLSNISEALSELGPVENLAPIQSGIKMISKLSSSISIDFYLSSEELNNKSHAFWKIISKNDLKEGMLENYIITCITTETIPIKKIGVSQAAIGVILLDTSICSEETLLNIIKRSSQQYAVLIVLNYLENDSDARKLKYDFYGKFLIINMKSTEHETLLELIENAITEDQKEQLKKRTYLNTIQPLFVLTKEVIQQEQYISNVRKNINTQLSNSLRKDEVMSNINDIINIVKTQLQYWNSDTDKNIKIKYEELNKPMTGRYSQELTIWSNRLEDLERKEIAEKAERLMTAINDAFLNSFESKICKEVSSDFANDYNQLLLATNSTLSKLNRLLLEKGIASSHNTLSIDYSRFPNPENTIKNYIGFTRSYSGELGKKGASEYFAALREHTGSIMVAVGLLAPLNMISSAASGEASENKEGFFAQVAAFFKHMNDGIRMATAVVIIIMIIWGYFDLKKRIPRKRQEEFERELKKARENLLSEGKRMFNETSKDWQNNISSWLREAFTQLQNQIEKLTRDYSADIQKKSNEEKNRIQLLNQSLDNSIKRISNADRIIENSHRMLRDAVNDTEKAFR